MTAPALAVVGCVNMGKSSIVANLVEDDAILIRPEPGSTVRCAAYDLRLGDDAVFTLVDTPGFQNARRALVWIDEYMSREGDRVTPTKAVRAFHAAHENDPAFAHEVELLRPILNDGAGILYVVNGTQPYLARYEAEMRILAMTGAPRMAVINLHGSRSSYAEEWEEALRPWFKVTRFDAMAGGARLELFASFKGVDDAWAPIVDAAMAQLREADETRRNLAAAAIAQLMVDALTMEERAPLRPDRDVQTEKMSNKLFDRLRAREKQARSEVEALYRHHRLSRQESALALKEADLFNRDQWRLLGLSTTQLASAGAAAGALAGGVIDAGVGGASFLAGTLIGAAVGGLGAVWGGRSLAQVQVLGSPLGGKILSVGAPTGPEFPFVLLDRALLHWHAVAGRSHARRDPLALEGGDPERGLVAQAPREMRTELSRAFKAIRQGAEVHRDDLAARIAALGPGRFEPETDSA